MTSIDIDDTLYEDARRELGTKTKKDTVHEALLIVANRQRRAKGLLDDAALLALGVGPDIDDPEIMAGARR
jgi:Arc/MetJ family transcription regulator